MKEKITSYRKEIDNFIMECSDSFDDKKSNDNNYSESDLDLIIDKHLIMIGFFQHERLIHLIVTTLFALMAVIVLAVNMVVENVYLLILMALILILLVPYIFHYYTLENETQIMYDQYDKLLEIKEKLR